MKIIVRQVVDHVVEVSDTELLEHFGADNLAEVVELFPEVGNETDGFGWLLKDAVMALDLSERAGSLSDAYVKLEQVDDDALWVSVSPLKVEL